MIWCNLTTKARPDEGGRSHSLGLKTVHAKKRYTIRKIIFGILDHIL